jgi:hypothetical protein
LLFAFVIGVEADVFRVPGGDAQGFKDEPGARRPLRFASVGMTELLSRICGRVAAWA